MFSSALDALVSDGHHHDDQKTAIVDALSAAMQQGAVPAVAEQTQTGTASGSSS